MYEANSSETKPLVSNAQQGDESQSEDDITRYRLEGPSVIDGLKRGPGEESRISLADARAEANMAHLTSNLGTMVHLFKGNIGTGLLAMPFAIRSAGLLAGTIGLALMGIVAIHCMHILVNASQHLCEKTQNLSLDYGEVVELAFRVGPKKLQRLANIARSVINLFLCITQIGFCCVYFVFISQSIEQVVRPNGDPADHTNDRVYMAILLPFIIILTFVRKLKHLVPFSLFANVVLAAGLVMIMIDLFQDLPPVSSRTMVGDLTGMPLFFGSAIYAFEGIGVVLPLENKMKSPEDFAGLTGVLNTSMTLVAAMYIMVGFYGYLKYGDDVLGSITLNLPHEPIYIAVKLMFAAVIFITYALQFYVAMEIMWPPLRNRIANEDRHLVWELIFRVILVSLTFLLAVAIPDLSLFISLVGAAASSSLALIFPPILDVVAFWDEMSSLRFIKNFLILIFGLVGFITGTAVSVQQIIRTFA